jgi:hypothetical protein
MDARYCQFTPKGVLSALAAVFIKNNEVIATTQIPFSTTVVASISKPIGTVAVIQNTNNKDNNEMVAPTNAPKVNFIEKDCGTPFLLAEYVKDREVLLFEKLFNPDVFNKV